MHTFSLRARELCVRCACTAATKLTEGRQRAARCEDPTAAAASLLRSTTSDSNTIALRVESQEHWPSVQLRRHTTNEPVRLPCIGSSAQHELSIQPSTILYVQHKFQSRLFFSKSSLEQNHNNYFFFKYFILYPTSEPPRLRTSSNYGCIIHMNLPLKSTYLFKNKINRTIIRRVVLKI